MVRSYTNFYLDTMCGYHAGVKISAKDTEWSQFDHVGMYEDVLFSFYNFSILQLYQIASALSQHHPGLAQQLLEKHWTGIVEPNSCE